MGIKITCGECGHNDEFDAFTHTEIAGELPKGVYQCPKCRAAIQQKQKPPTVHPSGWVEPGRIDLEPVQSSL